MVMLSGLPTTLIVKVLFKKLLPASVKELQSPIKGLKAVGFTLKPLQGNTYSCLAFDEVRYPYRFPPAQLRELPAVTLFRTVA